MTISLVMIVKNEAEVLRRNLPLLKPAVDEWVIVDTGSTDDTRAVIEEYCGVVRELPWEDFVTTKNKGGQTTGLATVTRVFRSLNATLDPSDTLLGTIGVPVLGPGATSTGTLSPTLPAGTYYIIVVVDADNDVVEAKEGTANQKKVKKTVL